MALNIAVSGASGFIGESLCQKLQEEGHHIWPLVRKKSLNPRDIFYDYQNGQIEIEKLAHCQAVIHLAGKNITSGLWTKSFKEELYDSRIKSTKLIAQSLSRLRHGPSILLNASATGIYGDRADQMLDETSKPSHDFLAKLCIDWEASTQVARDSGVRVVNMRFGLVLDPHGGILKKQLPFYKMGMGAVIGSGEQYLSYVTRDELVAQILFLLKSQVSGPVNLVALNPITNKEFTLALAKALGRKTCLKVPSFLLRALGDQGHMLLASARVYPKVLMDLGFNFSHESIEQLLQRLT